MEQAIVDGVIGVERGGGVVFFAFVEGDKKDVAVFFLYLVDALAHGGRAEHVECGADLVARVVRMYAQRAGEGELVFQAEFFEMGEPIREQFADFLDEEHFFNECAIPPCTDRRRTEAASMALPRGARGQ